ncbi:MAG: acetoacetate--CoA ligase [Cellvibrionales bacterium TMED49]|nr:MAG: acetoacetate--CoA ligase [Cellvibrionales bacterium TMED49]
MSGEVEKLLWKPTQEQIMNSNLQRFMDSLSNTHSIRFPNYNEFHKWSVEDPENFWSAVWTHTAIKSSVNFSRVLVEGDKFPGARWFSGARLNYAENLLRTSSEKVAVIGRLEDGTRTTITYQQLYRRVEQCAAAIRSKGVKSGDRVAGFLPNVIESIISMLAVSSIGAIWSSCSPDFGLNGVVDRFGQIKPKLLIACDGYFYNGKTIDCFKLVKELCKQLKSIQCLVIVPVIGTFETSGTSELGILFENFLVKENTPKLVFEQLPFDHPLFIMFSSGTTGAPKCIVHGAGGTLIQHLKEHRLHVNLTSHDKMFFFTTCGWMMWNWLVSALASEVTLVLFDGSPFYPMPKSLFDLVEEERVTVFGTSAKYLAALERQGVKPSETHDITALRSILSTGSPLSRRSFRYVYRGIKSNISLASISGGTDIISCFVLGNPCLPVWEGEIQCIGLGMAVEVWDEYGKSVREKKGELVCTKPFPSAPIYFWNDKQNKKYLATYFDVFPGIWAQGDIAEVSSRLGIMIHGRSDSTLNPAGVRIGTAEIYRQLEMFDELLDYVCVGQVWEDDMRLILFVVLEEGVELTAEICSSICSKIREETTPRHVPKKIIAVADIPRTLNGKTAELAVRKILHNEPITNFDALANPESLDLFRNLIELTN